MEPIIYSSQDASAPQLSLTAGALNTVIKGCLVTGYGDKPAAGWEIAYEDMATKKLAIRSTNVKSIKSVLLLDNTSTSSASVTAYTGWDNTAQTGTNQFGSGYFVNKWETNTPGWVLIATDSFFYFFINYDSPSFHMRVFQGFGDVYLLTPGEGCSALIASAGTGISPANTGYNSIATSMGVSAKFPSSLFPKVDSNYGWGDRSPNSSTGNSHASDIAILSRFALYQNKDSAIQPTIELPGMLMPYSEIASYVRGSDNIDRLANQFPYVNPILGMYQPYHGRVWIHTDDWG